MKFINTITFLALLMLLSCNREKAAATPEVIEKDISTLSLPELKSTLRGNWRLVYTWQFYNGRKDPPNTYWDFFSSSDSIKYSKNSIEIGRTNVTYTKARNYFSVGSTYIISFSIPSGNISLFCSAERMKNDTLILKEQSSSPMSYYLVK